MMDTETGVMRPQAKESLEPREAERGGNRFSSRAFPGSIALDFAPVKHIWTSGLPDCEGIGFSCFKPSGL